MILKYVLTNNFTPEFHKLFRTNHNLYIQTAALDSNQQKFFLNIKNSHLEQEPQKYTRQCRRNLPEEASVTQAQRYHGKFYEK